MFFYKRECIFHKERSKRQSEIIHNLRSNQNHLETENILLKFAIINDDNVQVITNERGHFCIKRTFGIYGNTDRDFQISLYMRSLNSTEKVAHLEASIFKDELFIIIDDIQTTSINCGFGSALLDNLISYAKQNAFSLIKGELSVVDTLSHPERLFHFYEKFGFKISESRVVNNYNIQLNM